MTSRARGVARVLELSSTGLSAISRLHWHGLRPRAFELREQGRFVCARAGPATATRLLIASAASAIATVTDALPMPRIVAQNVDAAG